MRSSWRQSGVRFRFPHLAELKRALLREANAIYGYCEPISPSSMADLEQQGGAHKSDIMVRH